MNGSFRFLGAALDPASNDWANADAGSYVVAKDVNYHVRWKSVLSLHSDIRASIFTVRTGTETFHVQFKSIREEGQIISGTLIDSGRSFFMQFNESSIAKMTANGRTYKIPLQKAKGGWEVFAAAGEDMLALKHRPDGLITFAVLSKNLSTDLLNAGGVIRANSNYIQGA